VVETKWKMRVPEKVKVFFWLLEKYRLLTGGQSGEPSQAHSQYPNSGGGDNGQPMVDVQSSAALHHGTSVPAWGQTCLVTLWNDWKERNSRSF
jgi:hypothetical protein